MNTPEKRQPCENEKNQRRAFLRSCADVIRGVTIVGIAAPLLQACETTLEPRSGTSNTGGNNGGTLSFDVSPLSAEGQGLVTSAKGPDGYAVMIVRTGATSYSALSTRCTHQSCDVELPQNGSITCLCHSSRFTLDGKVITGPATAPLTSYPLTYDEAANTVTVTIS